MKKNFRTFMVRGMAAMLCTAALVAVSCDDDDEEPISTDVKVTGVTLDKTELTLAVGETATLTPTVTPSDATDKTVTWESDTPKVATVTDGGKVTALEGGTAKITVITNDGKFKAECTVTVMTGPAVTGVTLDKPELTVMVGETATLTATVAPDDAYDKSVTWESSATGIATVADGVVTGVAAGTATITVTTVSGGFTATCEVTVEDVSSEPLVWEDGFEDGDIEVAWLTMDADGDGFNWNLIQASSDPDMIQPIDGEYAALTNSFINNLGPLTPDNWMVTDAITLNGAQNFTLAWWCRGSDPNYAAENYGIFVSTTSRDDRSSFTQVGSDYTATNPEEQKTADLSAYAGQTVYIAFRHYNITDMYSMQVDKVQVFRGTGVPSSMQSVAPASVPGPVTVGDNPAFFYRRTR